MAERAVDDGATAEALDWAGAVWTDTGTRAAGVLAEHAATTAVSVQAAQDAMTDRSALSDVKLAIPSLPAAQSDFAMPIRTTQGTEGLASE